LIYLNCPDCGLTVTVRAPWLMLDHCPRCMARRRTAVRLRAGARPANKPSAAADAAARANPAPLRPDPST